MAENKPDVVLTFLMSVNLADQESNFRGLLDNIAEDPSKPKVRDFVIATTCILMVLGSIGWPVVMRVIAHLKKRSDAELKQDAIAVINGNFLVLPADNNTGTVLTLDLATLRTVPELGPAFVSTIYSLTAVWDRTQEILQG